MRHQPHPTSDDFRRGFRHGQTHLLAGESLANDAGVLVYPDLGGSRHLSGAFPGSIQGGSSEGRVHRCSGSKRGLVVGIAWKGLVVWGSFVWSVFEKKKAVCVA